MNPMRDIAVGALHLADVRLNPKPEALPGAGTLQHLANGLAGWALIGSLVAVVIGVVIGGLIGLLIIYIGTYIAKAYFDFEFVLTAGNIATGLIISITIGLIAGLVPARSASKLDPVTAMNSL